MSEKALMFNCVYYPGEKLISVSFLNDIIHKSTVLLADLIL